MNRPISIVLLIAIPIIVYINSLQNTFVYDDVFTVTDNYFIRNWGNFSSLFTHDYFKSSGEVTYRPVVTFSYFIDYSIWHLNPFGFHLANVLLHTVNVLLVYGFISILTKDRALPFLSGILFALHPMLTEAVNGISYREDLLATLFSLGAVLLWFISRNHFRRYICLYPLSLFSYLLALCSKEIAITLPLIIFLIDWIFGDRGKLKGNILGYYSGFIAVSCFYLLVRFVWLHNPVEEQLTYPGNSFLVNLLTMPKIVCSYITRLFFPVRFNAEYIIPFTKTPFTPIFLCSVLFLGVIGVICYRCYRYSGFLFFFILWFFATLLPTLNIIPIANIMAERYLYLPFAGFCPILSYILAGIWRNARRLLPVNRLHGNFKQSKIEMLYSVQHDNEVILSDSEESDLKFRNFNAVVVAGLIAIPLILCSLFTITRNKTWKTPLTFWSRAVEDSPKSARAHNNLGMIFHLEGKTDLAISEFQSAVAIESDPEYHHNLGMAYQQKGLKEKALQEYMQVLAVNPRSAITYNNIGNILVDQGRPDEGILKFKEAIQLKSNYYDAHYNLGLACFRKGLMDESMEAFKRAIHYEPDHAEAHSCLGTVYVNKGLFENAIAEYEETLRLKPDYPTAYKNLGLIYLNHHKDVQKALRLFQEFLRLYPQHNDAEIVRKTVAELQSLSQNDIQKNKP